MCNEASLSLFSCIIEDTQEVSLYCSTRKSAKMAFQKEHRMISLLSPLPALAVPLLKCFALFPICSCVSESYFHTQLKECRHWLVILGNLQPESLGRMS